MTSVLSLCSPASLVTAGLDVAVADALSEDALTQGAGPGSGESRPVLWNKARTKELCACSTALEPRMKWSHKSLNSLPESSPMKYVSPALVSVRERIVGSNAYLA